METIPNSPAVKKRTITKVTRLKISTPIHPTSSWSEFNNIIKELQSEVRLASNKCITMCNVEYSLDPDNRDTVNKRGTLSKDMYDAARMCAPSLNSYNANSISREIGDLYFGKSAGCYANKMRRGDGNPPMSYGKNIPIPLAAKKYFKFSRQKNGMYNFAFPLFSRKSKEKWNLKIEENSMKDCFHLVDGMFTVGIDATSGDIKNTIEKCMSGEYIMCGSKLIKNGKKYYINLVCQIPVSEEYKLDDSRILGVDLGINNPAYVAVNFDDKIGCSFGGKYIIDQKMKYERQLIDAQKMASVYGKPGHGRNSFVHVPNNIRSKRSNYAETCNRRIADKVVKFALSNGCGIIRMEDLSGFSSKLQKDKFLGKWTYYQLKEFIEQKAIQYGIKVELVNPINTSVTCSKCGMVAKENRPKGDKGAEYFECVNCGYHTNADFNAARNIAMSKPVKKRKE